MCESGPVDRLTQAALDRLVDVAQQRLGVSAALLCDTEARMLASSGRAGPDTAAPGLAMLCGVAILTSQAVVRGGAPAEGQTAAEGAAMGLPVRDASGRLLGALAVAATSPRAWSAREVASLQGLVVIVARELRRLEEAHDAARAVA